MMITRSRRITLAVVLLLSGVISMPMSVHCQGPAPTVDTFLEARTEGFERFPRLIGVSPANATMSEGLGNWYTQYLFDQTVIRYPSIVLDAADLPHLAYVEHGSSYETLKYAKYDGSVWHNESLDVLSGFSNPRVVVDSFGHPHISYCSGSAFDCLNIKYAYDNGSGWQLETVDSTGSVNRKSNLEIDSNNHLHMSYIDAENHTLKYAQYDGDIWHIEVIASAQNGATSIALDFRNFPHITYLNNDSVMYIYYDGIAWQVERIGDGWEGSGASISLDTADRPHIAYFNQSYKLIYTYYDGKVWVKQTLAQGDWASTQFVLKLDKSDRPHIFYQDDTMGYGLYYLHYGDSVWQSELISQAALVQSFALNSEGNPHVLYTYDSGSRLYYAMRINDPSGWSALTFASYRDMNFEVYTAKGDGTNPMRRTVHAATDYTPEFNRGATRIAFVSTRDGNPEIYTMRADGANQMRLTANTAGDYLPTWSPDGTKIAFYSTRDGNAEIYVMNADGTNQKRLTINSAWDGHPTWSPDGSKIAFVSDRSGGDELWTMNADGSNQKQLSYGLGVAAYPDWSPDGRRIAFNDDFNRDGWLDVAVINADGTGLIHPLGSSPAYVDQMAPVWSPDGMYLAFARLQWINYYGNWYWVDSYINYILNLEGSHVYTLVDSGYDWWPDWQTTDITAPSSQVFAPTWSEVVTFTVQWQGSDVGLSGLRFYDVQYRDGITGTWTDWLTKTVKTSALFTGEYGHTYYLRSRAYDYAGNVESYLADGDASTHVYRYALTGRVLGNRGQPVFAAVVESTPAALNVAMTNHNGEFILYYDDAGIFTIEASRNDFNILPPMKHISVPYAAAPLTFYLPPADDAVIDGNFEEGDLTAWEPAGEIVPVLTSTVHTGDAAVMLGGSFASTMIAPSWRSIIQQEIEMPTPPMSTTLSLLYQVIEAEPISDTLEVYLIGPTQTLTYTLPLTVNHWEHRWWDLSTWDNPTLTLQIVWYQSEMTRTAGILLDEISLGTAIQGAYSVYLPLVLRNSR